MAIEQIFETLPLHYLQHGISKFGAINVALALFVIVAVGVIADYAWMLRLRSKMVRTFKLDESGAEIDNQKPPGPFPYPIIGNTFQLPDHKPWLYFEELSKKYNTPIITFWIGRSDSSRLIGTTYS